MQRHNPCKVDTCANGGSCYADKFERFKCFCKDGFTGAKCEIDESKL